MASLWTANLTPAEAERYAYLQGDALLALYAADLTDCERRVDAFDVELEDKTDEAFDAGKDVGMGIDAAQKIKDLEAEITALKASHQRCRDNLQGVLTWLSSGCGKTAQDRKAFLIRLCQALNATPRY